MSIQSDFSSSLSEFKCVWKPSLRPSGAGSEKLSWFFQDPGLGEGFLALKGSLGDSGRFRCVWPPEEIFFFFFFVIQRGCAAVLGTVETSWRVSGRETSTFYLADI